MGRSNGIVFPAASLFGPILYFSPLLFCVPFGGLRFVCTIRVKLIKLPCKDFRGFLPPSNGAATLRRAALWDRSRVHWIPSLCKCGPEINWHMVVKINRTEKWNSLGIDPPEIWTIASTRIRGGRSHICSKLIDLMVREGQVLSKNFNRGMNYYVQRHHH